MLIPFPCVLPGSRVEFCQWCALVRCSPVCLTFLFVPFAPRHHRTSHHGISTHLLHFGVTGFLLSPEVIEHSCSTEPLKSPWCTFHGLQKDIQFFMSLLLDSHTDIVQLLVGCHDVNTVGQQFVHHSDHQGRSAHVCFTHTSVINLALLSEQDPQVMSPTSSYLKVTGNLFSVADGEDEDLNVQARTSPIFSGA